MSAGDLLSRTHEELVLLLIQLRRQNSITARSIEQCCTDIHDVQVQNTFVRTHPSAIFHIHTHVFGDLSFLRPKRNFLNLKKNCNFTLTKYIKLLSLVALACKVEIILILILSIFSVKSGSSKILIQHFEAFSILIIKKSFTFTSDHKFKQLLQNVKIYISY